MCEGWPSGVGALPSNRDFFAQKQAAAAFKHGILARYPAVFAGKAGSVTAGRVAFLDGYAGPGRYDDGSPGSPLLFVRTAQLMSKSRAITAIFVEQDSTYYKQLCDVLAAAVPTGAGYRTVEGDLGRQLPALLPVVAGLALFAFLDPFGTALDREQLRTGLLSRTGAPTEVLLHFSVTTVARIGGLLRAAERGERDLTRRELRTVANVDRFLGGDWWQTSFRAVAGDEDLVTATDVALKVADHYCTTLAAETGFQSIAMPVRPAPSRVPKYILVLFTRHKEGVWEFASSLGPAGRDWQEAIHNNQVAAEAARLVASEAHGQISLFDFVPQAFDPEAYELCRRDAWAQEITENIRRLLDQHSYVRIIDRTVDVYGSLLGQAWAKHVRQAVKELHRVGEIGDNGRGDFHKRPLVRLPLQRGASMPGAGSASGPRPGHPEAAPRP